MMSWKLLAFIVIMALVLIFIGFNLDNRCDISIVFVTFHAVPVVITILGAYLVGLVSALVLSIGRRRKVPAVARNKSPQRASHSRPADSAASMPDQSTKAP